VNEDTAPAPPGPPAGPPPPPDPAAGPPAGPPAPPGAAAPPAPAPPSLARRALDTIFRIRVFKRMKVAEQSLFERSLHAQHLHYRLKDIEEFLLSYVVCQRCGHVFTNRIDGTTKRMKAPVGLTMANVCTFCIPAAKSVGWTLVKEP
jgi:hypothetical protein